ncbi:MAG: HPP family protein [Halobacteriaceae archaeon]
MVEGAREWFRAVLGRLQRVERREIREFRRWIQITNNLLWVSIVLVVPLVIGLLTYLSNTIDVLPFLLFPPLASGTYSLFRRPESRIATPRRFVGGLTTGAVCGWIALELTARYWYDVPPEAFTIHPGAAAFGIFLTGVATWTLDFEESQAYSTALLILVTGVTQLVYVVSVFLSSSLVAGAFVLWRRYVYERRAEYLYGTLQSDDQIIVPVRGDGDRKGLVALAGRVAGRHDAGKVVLLDVVPAEEAGAESGGDAAVAELEALAADVESQYGVPCRVVVARSGGNDAQTALQTARDTDCNLVVVPYETEDGRLSLFLRRLFAASIDVIAVRTTVDRTDWERVLVPVRRDGDVAHAMLDFAQRLVGSDGTVTACHCISEERDRRTAETMLADLVEPFDQTFETRVARTSVEQFLAENAQNYDLTLVGASTDRSPASRFLSPPTFERLEDLDGDVAVVHRD